MNDSWIGRVFSPYWPCEGGHKVAPAWIVDRRRGVVTFRCDVCGAFLAATDFDVIWKTATVKPDAAVTEREKKRDQAFR